MKIGIDVRLWNETGIGRYIRNLIVHLNILDRKNEYVLFARSQDVFEIQEKVSSKNFTVIKADISWHSLSEQVAFPRLLNQYNLDLMHFPYFSVPIFYKKPYVVTVHDLIINHFSTGRATTLPMPFYKLKRAGYKLILKRAIHDSKKVIVPSLATKDEILSYYKHDVNKDDIRITPEGVDDSISDFSPITYKRKSPYFLYVGNAYPHKNLETLIKAFNFFSELHPDFKLYLIGKKDYFYKKVQEKNKNGNIEFLGFIKDDELSKLYKQATATFAPSFMEGFGLTTLEAMKMGSLVAASEIPSFKEVCSSHAFYFNPQDALSIKKTMENIISISETDKKARIQDAQKHAESFSWKKTARLTLEVYESCL